MNAIQNHISINVRHWINVMPVTNHFYFVLIFLNIIYLCTETYFSSTGKHYSLYERDTEPYLYKRSPLDKRDAGNKSFLFCFDFFKYYLFMYGNLFLIYGKTLFTCMNAIQNHISINVRH